MARSITIRKDNEGNVLERVQTAGAPMDIPGLGYQPPQQSFMSEIQNRILAPQTYNVYEDPAYKALQMQSQEAAMTGQQNAMAALNKRGILDSTITARSGEQIQADAAKNLTLAVPELMARQQQQRQQELQNLIGLENMAYGRQQDELNRQFRNQEFEYQKERDAKVAQIEEQKRNTDEAYRRWENLGYADKNTALLLGVPEGKVFSAIEAANQKFERDKSLEVLRNEADMNRLIKQQEFQARQAQLDNAAAMARTLAGRSSSSTQPSKYDEIIYQMEKASTIMKNDPVTYGSVGKDKLGKPIVSMNLQQAQNRERLLETLSGQQYTTVTSTTGGKKSYDVRQGTPESLGLGKKKTTSTSNKSTNLPYDEEKQAILNKSLIEENSQNKRK